MSRHYPPATEGEMDRLLLIAPPIDAAAEAMVGALMAESLAAMSRARRSDADPGDEDDAPIARRHWGAP